MSFNNMMSMSNNNPMFNNNIMFQNNNNPMLNNNMLLSMKFLNLHSQINLNVVIFNPTNLQPFSHIIILGNINQFYLLRKFLYLEMTI